MPWQETDPLSERTPCMATYLRHVYAMTERCARVGMRRHTGDTWVRRDTEPGLAGREEPSRAPHRGPHRLSAAGAAVRLAAKRAHRHGGPRQILPSRARRRPARALPAPRPAGERCQRAGVSPARTRRRGSRHPGAIPLQAKAPKAVWTADGTGQCRPGDGLDGSPLPVADAHSRVRCSGSARRSTPPVAARPSLARVCQV